MEHLQYLAVGLFILAVLVVGGCVIYALSVTLGPIGLLIIPTLVLAWAIGVMILS